MSSGTLGGSVPGGSTTVREASGGQEHHLIQRFYADSPQRRFLNPCTSRSRGAPSLRIAKSYVTLTSVRMRERTDGTKPQAKKGGVAQSLSGESGRADECPGHGLTANATE